MYVRFVHVSMHLEMCCVYVRAHTHTHVHNMHVFKVTLNRLHFFQITGMTWKGHNAKYINLVVKAKGYAIMHCRKAKG